VNPEEVYLSWAPPESVWSPWAIPVPFAQIVCVPLELERELAGIDFLAHGVVPESDLAVVLDLPGDQAVRLSLALALRGFRPVPVIDGSPGPDILGTSRATFVVQPAVATRVAVAVDMSQTLRWLCIGAELLPSLKISANANPVFLLDALRTGRAGSFGAESFDNRWKTFPQDFPSARFLKEHGIRRVLSIQEIAGQPSEDLAHVLLRWQEEGISIYVSNVAAASSSELIRVNRPSQFRALWQRALALIGLKRATVGGFGAWPQGSGGS
jgi:hypothetical protein